LGVTIKRYLLATLLFGLVGCDGGPAAPTEWPPRLHRLDERAASLPASAALEWKIDSDKPLGWSGNMNLKDRRFLPVSGRFEVEGGVLVSRLGNMVKRATFGAWAPVRKSAVDPETIGWGPCLVKGEVIVPNVFLAKESAGVWVENRYEVEDLGERHSLIRLRVGEEDRLCVRFREPLEESAKYGQWAQEGDATVFGPFGSPTLRLDFKVFRLGKGEAGTVPLEEPDASPVLAFTTNAPGTRACMGEWEFLRKGDGWHLGGERVGPTR
jgi:hypothetical protein